jgi:hypothetical protein
MGKFGYYVATNEVDVQRLVKVVSQVCVDALVHVRLELVKYLYGKLPPEIITAMDKGRLLDLVDFVRLTHTW